jgi:hypothetical protein
MATSAKPSKSTKSSPSAKAPKSAPAAKPSATKGKPGAASKSSKVAAKHATTVVKDAPKSRAAKGNAKGKGKAPKAAKHAKPVVRQDAPKPGKKGKAGKPKKGRQGEIVIQEAGRAEPGRMKIAPEKLNLKPATSKARFKTENYEDFFVAEIMAELESEATIYNDRIARWRCQCCDAIIPVPRRTEVFHGDYHLVHDDIEGLLVNGEKFVPKAYTPIEVVQPGRLRNPWTGKTIEGKDLGTTGSA